ncbi:MAG: TolC family protein [Deltaproteobacteria bacterium]|nr:TolC family protein [Deltaproteobacteria bacterium]
MTNSALLVVVQVAAAQLGVVDVVVIGEPIELGIVEALQIAEQRSENVDIARAGVRRADAERTRAFSDWLPQASALLSYDRTLRTEFDDVELPGFGSALSALPFGQPNTWRAGVALSQNVFRGGRTVGAQRIAEALHRQALVGLESARAQAVLQAAQAYYDVVLAERLLFIAEQSRSQAELTVEQTRLGVSNGTMPEFDLLRAQVALDNQGPTLLQRHNELQAARLRLRQVLELPAERPLLMTSTLEGELVDITPEVRALAPALGETVPANVRQAQDARSQSDAAVAVAWGQHLPQLDLAMNYGLVSYPDKITSAFDDVRDNWTVGVALRVPLFMGFRVEGDVESARAQVMEASERLALAAELADLEQRTTAQTLAASEATFRASAGVVDNAKKARLIADLRFAEGVSTLLEVRDAQLLLDQAEVNRARAARDLQIARARQTLLPSLPLVPSSSSPSFSSSSLTPLPAQP